MGFIKGVMLSAFTADGYVMDKDISYRHSIAALTHCSVFKDPLSIPILFVENLGLRSRFSPYVGVFCACSYQDKTIIFIVVLRKEMKL